MSRRPHYSGNSRPSRLASSQAAPTQPKGLLRRGSAGSSSLGSSPPPCCAVPRNVVSSFRPPLGCATMVPQSMRPDEAGGNGFTFLERRGSCWIGQIATEAPCPSGGRLVPAAGHLRHDRLTATGPGTCERRDVPRGRVAGLAEPCSTGGEPSSPFAASRIAERLVEPVEIPLRGLDRAGVARLGHGGSPRIAPGSS
jgi:hypothetical protein